MTSPGASKLRTLILAISGDEAVHIDIRNECHLLMMAIDRNDLTAVAAHVSRIEELAVTHDIVLPDTFRTNPPSK